MLINKWLRMYDFLVFKVFPNCSVPLGFDFVHGVGHFFALVPLLCCQPDFVSVYLFDSNNGWVSVHVSSRFPKRRFGAGINYLSWLHSTSLSHADQSVTDILLDSSPLRDALEVDTAAGHPWVYVATSPYAGEVPSLVTQDFSGAVAEGSPLFLTFLAFNRVTSVVQNLIETFNKHSQPS